MTISGQAYKKQEQKALEMAIQQQGLRDLHLHLDGSISVNSARELAELGKIQLPQDDTELKNQLMCPPDCRNLNEYLERFNLPIQLMQNAEAIERSAFNLCRELMEKGLIYAEIRFAPQKHCQRGLSQEEVICAAIRGVEHSGMPAQLILCCMRDGADNAKENLQTVRLTSKYLGKGVCACDLAGAEALFGNEKYAYIFQEANALEIPFTIHSGEAAGPESVKLAIAYGAKRIGHGVRAIEDPVVVQMLVDQQIPLEICPTSNLNTCVFPRITNLPIRQLMNAGVILTINSDNMSVSNTDVRTELLRVAEAFALPIQDLETLLANSARSAFPGGRTNGGGVRHH